jgi:hypothetical protein
MRVVHGLVAGSIALVAVAAGACGSTTSETTGTSDAGPDVAAPGLDSSTLADTGDDGGLACVIDADLTTAAPPDAALNDSGASVGTCISCARTTCSSGVVACNTDCACNVAFDCLFNCLSGVGGALTFCAASCFGSATSGGDAGGGGGVAGILNSLDPDERNLLLCAATQCGDPCGVGGLLGGNGGGDSGAAADASADAPIDSPSDATGE